VTISVGILAWTALGLSVATFCGFTMFCAVVW